SSFPPTRSAAKPAGTRGEPAVAMGFAAARIVCGGGGIPGVGATERPSLPAVGDPCGTVRAFRLVCHLCFRAEAGGFRAQADSEGLSGSRRSHALRRATGSAKPTDHAFAAQLQGADRFLG